jgi:NAD(P)-dependent dehydrogenase (short-subunit alcohol dehydrogenase family)
VKPVSRKAATGRVAVVAGSRGLLGTAACEALSAAGWLVVGIDVATGGTSTASHVECDVTDRPALASALRDISDSSGPIDAVANCAGLNDAVERWASETEVERDRAADELLAANVRGAATLIEVASEHMRRTGHGSAIASVASLYAGVASDPRLYAASPSGLRDKHPVYEASKAAVLALTRHYAVRLAGLGIRVNCISPGGVSNAQPDWFVRAYAERVPLGRMARPAELGDAVEFLLSDRSTYITGHNLVLDGGYSAW